MSSMFTVLKRVFIGISVILCSQCTTLSQEDAMMTQKSSSPNQVMVSPYTMPAQAYLALAKKQTGEEKQALMIMAAGRLIYDGQWRQAQVILSQTGNLSPLLASEKKLLLAKINVIRDKPHAAIPMLASIENQQELPLYYQAQFHELLALAYQATGRMVESVNERIKLEALLPTEDAKTNNRRALWLSLISLPRAELETVALEVHDNSLLGGWVELALIANQAQTPSNTLAQINDWQAEHPDHPANLILPSPLDAVKEALFSPPKHMALLLPLTGSLAGPGMAIKDGFMAAYHEKNPKASVEKIRIYDTNEKDIVSLYRRAVDEGADYIVGPLSKQDVAQINGEKHPVPVVFLNDLNQASGFNAYQFGFSPGNEARQVAMKAHKHGYSRALVIAPAGAWGDEVLGAFVSQWQMSGGSIRGALRYQPQDNFNQRIADFLRISHSEGRQKELKQLLGNHIEGTPMRRKDFDVIFLLAYPSYARQIMPLLKYYYAGDVPVYGISIVYGGSPNSMQDRDLDGLIFCDMPWIFNHHQGQKNWPEQLNSYDRLYALGKDSFALSRQLNQLLLFPAISLQDQGGALYLNPNHQISRILAWGQFNQGLAQPLALEDS